MAHKLQRTTKGYHHWCIACNAIHMIPENWECDGNMETPTFTPSVRHQFVSETRGTQCCHYSIREGIIIYYSDCTHQYASFSVPLMAIPEGAI